MFTDVSWGSFPHTILITLRRELRNEYVLPNNTEDHPLRVSPNMAQVIGDRLYVQYVRRNAFPATIHFSHALSTRSSNTGVASSPEMSNFSSCSSSRALSDLGDRAPIPCHRRTQRMLPSPAPLDDLVHGRHQESVKP